MIVLPLLIATSAFAVEADDCAAAQQLAALYQVRSIVLKTGSTSWDVQRFIDGKINDLRGPLPDGGYRWVRWMRPMGDNPPYEKHGHEVVAVQGNGSDHFEASGDHAYSVRIAVPSKRSLFNGNHSVYVGTVRVTYDVDGRERTKEEPINDWMNPDTSHTIDLGTIADHVQASLDASTSQDTVRQALVEIHMLKAVQQDDPSNPNYDTIMALQRLRNSGDPDAVDDAIAQLDPGSLPLVHIIGDLRRADDLMHSKKQKDQDKGQELLKETLRRLR